MTALVLTAHGSADPRSAANARAVAGHLRRAATGFDVRVAFCDHNAPSVRAVLDEVAGDAVVAPFLLTSAYHARVDIPALVAESAGAGARVVQADVLGEDVRLLQVLGQRLTALGASRFDPRLGVVVVAVGSSDPAANARTARVVGPLLNATRWAGVEVGFATGPAPSVADSAELLRRRGATRVAIAPWFLAHGRLTDRVAASARDAGVPMAEPLGAHRLVAATVLDRVEEALANRAAA